MPPVLVFHNSTIINTGVAIKKPRGVIKKSTLGLKKKTCYKKLSLRPGQDEAFLPVSSNLHLHRHPPLDRTVSAVSHHYFHQHWCPFFVFTAKKLLAGGFSIVILAV